MRRKGKKEGRKENGLAATVVAARYSLASIAIAMATNLCELKYTGHNLNRPCVGKS